MSEQYGREIDFTWLVFDKDDADENETKVKRFDEAYKMAKEEKLNIALSNEVFEVWLLLHFAIPGFELPIPRTLIYTMLENEIIKFEPGYIYKHGKKEIINFVQMYGNEELAITNAKILSKFHVDKLPIEKNPSTEVFMIVEELRS